jgi:hypothetical protein
VPNECPCMLLRCHLGRLQRSTLSLQAQVLDLAADAGAEDVQPVVEESELTGFRASWSQAAHRMRPAVPCLPQ